MEIKFRGKRIDNEEWAHGNLYIGKITGCFILIPKAKASKNGIKETAETFEVIPSTVGQFAEKTDKNKKEAYVDDIIKYHNAFGKEYIGVIKFGEYNQDGSGGEYAPAKAYGFYVERTKTVFDKWDIENDFLNETEYDKQMSIIEISDFEIIGNIHEEVK